MIISQLKFNNFRNLENNTIYLSNTLNIFIGNNGMGKTNILESIYTLSLTKSHRNISDRELINSNKSNCSIEAICESDKGSKKALKLALTNDSKMVFVDKINIKKYLDFIKQLDVIIFTPDDLNIIKGSPSERRNYLNIAISQLDNEYSVILNNYKKLIKMKNEYLKKTNCDRNYINILNEKLAEYGSYLIIKRKKFIDEINSKYNTIYSAIIKDSTIDIKYDTLVTVFSSVIEDFKDQLNKIMEKEIKNRQSLIGPHRDNFLINLDNNNIVSYGSQGQQRIAVIALKLSELDIYHQYRNEYPILLLDDIFSEIDIQKRNRILKFLNKQIQIIITTTDLKNINKRILKIANVKTITNGKIK